MTIRCLAFPIALTAFQGKGSEHREPQAPSLQSPLTQPVDRQPNGAGGRTDAGNAQVCILRSICFHGLVQSVEIAVVSFCHLIPEPCHRKGVSLAFVFDGAVKV